MDCRAYREGHPAESAEAREHRAACAACRAFAGGWELLREYPEIPAGPGFLRGVRRKLAPRILRFAAPVAAAAAALLAFTLMTVTPPSRPAEATEEERELIENLELLQNYELLRTLEMVGESGSPLLEEKR